MGLNDLHERRSITPINDLFSKWDMSCRKFESCWRAPASEVSMPQIVANLGKSIFPMIWDNSCACSFISRTTSSVPNSADSPDGLSVQPLNVKNQISHSIRDIKLLYVSMSAVSTFHSQKYKIGRIEIWRNQIRPCIDQQLALRTHLDLWLWK